MIQKKENQKTESSYYVCENPKTLDLIQKILNEAREVGVFDESIEVQPSSHADSIIIYRKSPVCD